MKKIMALAVFGVAAVAVAMAVTLGTPSVKAWDSNDVCFVWYSENGNEAASVPSVFDGGIMSDAWDKGCSGAVTYCSNRGLYLVWYDQSYRRHC